MVAHDTIYVGLAGVERGKGTLRFDSGMLYPATVGGINGHSTSLLVMLPIRELKVPLTGNRLD